MGDTGYNRIANAAGQFSGMMWTCDEFPFATSVEGGAGARTYCTPQNAGCGSSTGMIPGTVFISSEQDFQSNALCALREAVLHKRVPPATKATTKGIWRYHFRTRFQPDTELAAVSVEWYDDASEWFSGYQKRSIEGRDIEESIVRIFHSFYNNGTAEVRHEPVFKDKYKILRRSWDRHLVGNGSAVDLEQGNPKRSMGHMQSHDNDNGTVGLSADWLNASGNSFLVVLSSHSTY
ncbi:hypothetical protein NW760_012655 [Fusarium oxysporum]|nr:hypothetical protein NW769_014877 [Fusarium oxysporum]KAJ4219316.1 hypothetical protein NW760_012655 [Fusarium oxysporum]